MTGERGREKDNRKAETNSAGLHPARGPVAGSLSPTALSTPSEKVEHLLSHLLGIGIEVRRDENRHFQLSAIFHAVFLDFWPNPSVTRWSCRLQVQGPMLLGHLDHRMRG